MKIAIVIISIIALLLLVVRIIYTAKMYKDEDVSLKNTVQKISAFFSIAVVLDVICIAVFLLSKIW